jgi:hypothetical protein
MSLDFTHSGMQPSVNNSRAKAPAVLVWSARIIHNSNCSQVELNFPSFHISHNNPTLFRHRENLRIHHQLIEANLPSRAVEETTSCNCDTVYNQISNPWHFARRKLEFSSLDYTDFRALAQQISRVYSSLPSLSTKTVVELGTAPYEMRRY